MHVFLVALVFMQQYEMMEGLKLTSYSFMLFYCASLPCVCLIQFLATSTPGGNTTTPFPTTLPTTTGKYLLKNELNLQKIFLIAYTLIVNDCYN
jgi:hypothetical protein